MSKSSLVVVIYIIGLIFGALVLVFAKQIPQQVIVMVVGEIMKKREFGNLKKQLKIGKIII